MATIQVVDDEDLVRKMIARMLQPMGYCILHTANGDEALTICERWNGAIHLMVTDVTMPGTNGIDLVDCATDHWPNIKIFFITGFATDVAVRRGHLTTHSCPSPLRAINSPVRYKNYSPKTMKDVMASERRYDFASSGLRRMHTALGCVRERNLQTS